MKLSGTLRNRSARAAVARVGAREIVMLVLLMGVQLISLRIIGEYIPCIYEEVRNRPKS